MPEPRRRVGIAAGMLVAAGALTMALAVAQIGELTGANPGSDPKAAQAAPAAASSVVRVIPLTRAKPAPNAQVHPGAAPAAGSAPGAGATSASAEASQAAAPPVTPATQPAETNVGAASRLPPRADPRSDRIARLPDDAGTGDDAPQRGRRGARGFERQLGPFALASLCDRGFWFRVSGYLELAERVIEPTAQQKSHFDQLVQSAVQAKDEVQATCGAPVAMTAAGRFAAVEARLASVQRAVQMVRPALDSFYASLTDEQRARLDTLGTDSGARGRHRHRRHGSWR
jgi:hypothetical protein